ncbi:hydantoinase/oxoprolinase family protein [Neobacillus terrae]|uniref:hydantoinase/oxoprolinase family protein n=1 Tax=Neobacillus terrae TaxID=3034837 RepID=UPI001408388D|nr:hydantoinase/oxoprolinase family protein [Neobacillus terrae]NHM32473.1 hydantoinase/oxoprolinase family protein [Neobacillus terrae]
MIRVGVDVGGTNTDLILTGLGQKHVYHKVPSTKADQSIGIIQGVKEICDKAGIEPSDIDMFLHGTTVATNALIEHEGSKTGLITTKGFRDILHIGRHRRPHNFSIMQDIPFQVKPLIERKHRKVVNERIIPPGDIFVPLDESEVLSAINELKASGIKSIAVAFLFSFLNPIHEKRVGELIAELYPEAEVSLSHEVISQYREFERFTTTAINAFTKPKMRSYMKSLEKGLKEIGCGAEILIMQSNGGISGIDGVSEKPVSTLMSGPAAGVIGTQFIGNLHNHTKLIGLDIGGTSADITVIPEQLLEIDFQNCNIAGYPVLFPQLDVISIGAGGGSIAWADSGGGFNVGPRSAGAEPGPACYNRGGTEATVTDANVILGRIDPNNFLGGRIELQKHLSEESMGNSICEPFNMDVKEAALSTLEIMNANMVKAIRLHSIQRGYDPREFALVAFGGAGPLHGCDVADALDIPTILIPPAPGITSAMGLLSTDLKFDFIRTIGVLLDSAKESRINQYYLEMVLEAEHQIVKDSQYGKEKRETITIQQMDCRYAGQGYELSIEFNGFTENWREEIQKKFDTAHQEAYGFAFEGNPIEIINLRVQTVGLMPDLEVPHAYVAPQRVVAASKVTKAVFGTPKNHQEYEVSQFERAELPKGYILEGPAIINGLDSTVVINPNWQGEVLYDSTIKLTRKGVNS